MSKIIPVSITTTEQAVTLDATYQFVWLRNMGENDCLLSDHSDIVAGDDNVTLVKAGESGRISTSGRAVYIKAVSGTSTGEIHAQNFSDAPFKSKAKGGGQSITVEPLTVNDNGVYTAPTGKAYSPVTVDVQEQPWQPLQDGYSNFWFELTDDTLSPWLNFSAKNNNATIDWGDGSGEVSLDTLTPTHTYSSAGKYIVKVKGVTNIARQFVSSNYSDLTPYAQVLKAVELNNEITTITSTYTFNCCFGLEHFYAHGTITWTGRDAFSLCVNLKTIDITLSDSIPLVFLNSCTNLKTANVKGTYTSISNNGIYTCRQLSEFTIPSSVTSIGNSVFAQCNLLSELHVQATTPPTIGTDFMANVTSAYIIYVPVGTAETYKAASGWSTYADHILEEGQTPNRMMLAKFKEETDEPQDDMR